MTIEERLEVVEKELNRTKRHNRYLLCVVLVFIGIGIIGASPSNWKSIDDLPPVPDTDTDGNVIKANGFSIEDENGKIRASLRMDRGEPELVLFDVKGKTRICLSMISKYGPNEGPFLEMLDKNRVTRLDLDMIEGSGEDKPGLALLDKSGKTIWSEP